MQHSHDDKTIYLICTFIYILYSKDIKIHIFCFIIVVMCCSHVAVKHDMLASNHKSN